LIFGASSAFNTRMGSPHPIACGKRDIHQGRVFGDGEDGRPRDKEKRK
jgi:hypothetical protein